MSLLFALATLWDCQIARVRGLCPTNSTWDALRRDCWATNEIQSCVQNDQGFFLRLINLESRNKTVVVWLAESILASSKEHIKWRTTSGTWWLVSSTLKGLSAKIPFVSACPLKRCSIVTSWADQDRTGSENVRKSGARTIDSSVRVLELHHRLYIRPPWCYLPLFSLPFCHSFKKI